MRTLGQKAAMKINRHLIWDYPADVAEGDEVLTRGGIEDIRALGLETIREYLPHIVLPQKIRAFWEWFLGLKKVHGDPDRGATGRH